MVAFIGIYITGTFPAQAVFMVDDDAFERLQVLGHSVIL